MAEQEPGADPQTTGQAPEGGQESEDQTFDLDYVKKLRGESAKYRTQRNDLQTKLDGFSDLGGFESFDALKSAASSWQQQEEQNKTEMEKMNDQISRLQAERDMAVQQAQDRLIQSAFVSEASKLGYANPADAYRLADLSDVTVDDDGTVKGVDKAVKALEGRLPLAKPKAPSLDGGAGGAVGGGQPNVTEADVRRMAAELNVSPKFLGDYYGLKIKE